MGDTLRVGWLGCLLTFVEAFVQVRRLHRLRRRLVPAPACFTPSAPSATTATTTSAAAGVHVSAATGTTGTTPGAARGATCGATSGAAAGGCSPSSGYSLIAGAGRHASGLLDLCARVVVVVLIVGVVVVIVVVGRFRGKRRRKTNVEEIRVRAM